ncbi:MAG: radical SAM protein [Deltaproteobacteria bacterium]|nr:radical SAM protein [Deltaproteobacteria bacterium]
MRVALVNPRPLWDRLGPMERFSPAIPPLGIVWPATVLAAAGHETRVIDQHAQRLDSGALVAELARFSPDLVGFSCLTFAMDGVVEAVRSLRMALPGVKVVLGNLHASLFHERLVESGIADFVVRGEGEIALPALAAALERAGSARGVPGITWSDGERTVVVPDAADADLDALPVPDWSLVRGIRYEAFRLRRFDQGPLPAAVQASRGCRFRCSFCSQNLLHRSVRVRSVDGVIRELTELNERFGITSVGFVDANFPPDKAYGLEFARKMRSTGLSSRIHWFTEVRADLVDEELIQALAAAGMTLVQFGIESGEPEVLRSMNKGSGWSDPKAPFDWCRREGVLTVGLFVIGMPGETEQQVESTIAQALRIDPDLAKFSVATPYPGSGLWYRYLDELAEAPPHKFSGWLDPARGGDHLLARHTIPSSRLAALQRQAMRRFYMRPGKLLRLAASGLLRLDTWRDGFISLLREAADKVVSGRKGEP